jgi:Lrp/AsnC family transcriptional regulator for asnA, asnC and gidA
MLKIDDLDHQILKILEEDSRISYRQLGQKLGIEESTARKRVVRLKEKGVIERFTIDVSDSTLGRTITAFITVYPSLKHVEEVVSQVVNLDEVIESYNLSGRCGVFLKATFGDMKALNAFISKIRGITGIVGIHTCISLETIKRSRVIA